MTVSPDPDSRDVPAIRPLLVGDLVGGRAVAGFAWTQPLGDVRSNHLDDRLVFEDDQDLVTPPDTSVPPTADNAEPVGPIPPNDLPADRIHSADSIDPALPLRADLLLDLPGSPWQPLARPLLIGVHNAGHRIWLSGGASRDLISGVPLPEVNDLDLAGTVPAGRFTEITYQTMRATRMTEFRTTVDPDILVCTVTSPWSTTTPIVEYRGLSQGGFQFPLVGSQIAEDSRHRDFSFNTLLYDVLDHLVLDACGSGLADLRADKRRFAPRNESTDPVTQAMILFRALKFAMRWHDRAPHDLVPLTTWLDALPPGFFDPLTEENWGALVGAHRRSVSAPVDRQREFAALLPKQSRAFLETLIGRAS